MLKKIILKDFFTHFRELPLHVNYKQFIPICLTPDEVLTNVTSFPWALKTTTGKAKHNVKKPAIKS